MTLVLIVTCGFYALVVSLSDAGGIGIGTALFLPYAHALAAVFVGPACVMGTLAGLATIGLSRRGRMSLQIWSTATISALCVVGVLAVAQFPFEWYASEPLELDGVGPLHPLAAIGGYSALLIALTSILATVGRRYIWTRAPAPERHRVVETDAVLPPGG
ncbi:hypothetical protein ELQ90_06905 [Labedella phragmitis]|uniref:Uncharacterized protein n=1 Tax=Labedella phragmitis TaxID=2498849 RepID=A0A444PVC1_9MICO|nr:hypothetical protein [Labedella phragmitis]RWZ51817.1 hypothetical protein ELQ90_06905 [Labedella phragmitis]